MSSLHCTKGSYFMSSLSSILVTFPVRLSQITGAVYEILLKVQQSCNRPGVAQRVPGGLGSQFFVTLGTWRWWGRQPQTPAAFTPRNVPGTHFH
jgi:hypothetical protein